MSITAKGENKECNENREVKRNSVQGDFAVVQWLRLHVPNAWGLGSIPDWGTRSHVLKLMILQTAQFSHSVVSNSATPRTAARQASLSVTNSQSLLKLMSIESVTPSNPLILCYPLLLLSSIFPSIRVFSKESVPFITWPKYQSSLYQVVKIMHRLDFKSLLMMCSVFSFFYIYSLFSINELSLLN